MKLAHSPVNATLSHCWKTAGTDQVSLMATSEACQEMQRLGGGQRSQEMDLICVFVVSALLNKTFNFTRIVKFPAVDQFYLVSESCGPRAD